MRRWFLSLFVCLALVMGVRMAKAANIGLENVPGGAAITYWTCADGYQTLINVQNVFNGQTVTLNPIIGAVTPQSPAILVHIVFYDQDSQEIMDFNVPLSAYDNWGAAITCENGQLVITPTPSFYQGPNNGGEVRRAPTQATEGYVTVAITALDLAGRPNDARDDINFRNADVLLPDGIILRSAMVNYAAGNAFALNSFSLVRFKNVSQDDPRYPDAWDCYTNPGPSIPVGRISPQDDMNGIRISMCELLAETGGAFLPTNFVVGAPNGSYWARYGNNGIVETSFVLIYPAQGGGNQLDMTVFDDNEMTQSAYYEAPEVAHIKLGTDIAAFDSGEVLISVRDRDIDGDRTVNNDPIPSFFGFSLVEGPNFVDIYPIVRSGFAYCDDNANGGAGVCSQF